MQSYKSIIAENTTLVLSTNSDLFKFLKGMAQDRDVVPAPRGGDNRGACVRLVTSKTQIRIFEISSRKKIDTCSRRRRGTAAIGGSDLRTSYRSSWRR